MAQAFRNPVKLLAACPASSAVRIIPIQRRCISQTARQCASAPAMQARPAQAAERSIRVASKEMMYVPSDIGLLRDTFIHPSGVKRPSLLRNPRGLLKLQYWRIRYRLRDAFSSMVLKWSAPKEKWYRPALKLNRGQIAPSAVALHQTMYTAFAEADSHTLRNICTDGIYDSFRARMATRPKGEKTRWELIKYNKRAKLMSNRAARLPIDGSAIRQAVVRIASRQKLTRYRPDGTIIPGTGKERDVVEYIVLQKMFTRWKEEDWKVWGTTDVTTLDQLEAALSRDL